VDSEKFGPVISQLWETIEQRKAHAATLTDGSSYTAELLNASPDKINKKIAEEAAEVIMAAKEYEAARSLGGEGVSEYGTGHDHLVYEIGDLLYHILVMCARWDISPNELAIELENRF